MKKAFITGVTGQDGSYLADLLLREGYEVFGMVRRSSTDSGGRIAHINNKNFHIVHGDLADQASLTGLIGDIRPDEVYNLAAQSHVGMSFKMPEFTADVTGVGPLRLLEAIRLNGLCEKTKFYQASTSELFGKVQEVPQKETTPFYPRSPYGIAKLHAHWSVINYREAYNMYACNGILFNHESPRRGENFVTRKITKAMGEIFKGTHEDSCMWVGNLDAKRDWGDARDYVKAMHLMLQQKTPQDYVIASGKQHTVRRFIELTANEMGFTMGWEGEGLDEIGYVEDFLGDTYCGQPGSIIPDEIIVRISEEFYRPAEVDTLLGDPSKAKKELGWKPRYSLGTTISNMVYEDFTK